MNNLELPEEQENLKLEPEQRKRTTRVIAKEFHGPIPAPEDLAGYEAICLGAANRIITMAENQAKHRQKLEKMTVFANSRDSLLGIVFAFLLGLTAIVGGIIAAIKGHPLVGGFFGTAGLAGVIIPFIYGTHIQDNKENKQS